VTSSALLSSEEEKVEKTIIRQIIPLQYTKQRDIQLKRSVSEGFYPENKATCHTIQFIKNSGTVIVGDGTKVSLSYCAICKDKMKMGISPKKN
jgi:hypothetical protein